MNYIRSLLVVRFFTMMAEQMMIFLVPFYVYKLTGSISASGLAFAIEFIPRIIGVAISPSVLNRWKEASALKAIEALKWSILVAYTLILMSPVDLNTALVFPLVAGLFGFFAELSFPILEKHLGYISDKHPDIRKDVVFSKQQSIDTVAMALGPVLSALLVGYFSHLEMLELFTLLQLAALAILFSASWLASPAHTEADNHSEDTPHASLLLGLKLMCKERSLVEVFITGFLLNLGLGILLLSSQDYLTIRLSVPGETFGVILSVAGTSCAITLYCLNKITQYVDLKTLSKVSALISATILIVIGTTQHYYLYFALFVLYFVTDNIFAVYIRTLRSQLFNGKQLISVLGCMIVLL
ncbi:MFS transporter, partial [Photobacterium halotolerans]|uniref:MFS transporter n=1 Tax=Photobacterium halotolerans TaxID=265726 RepID=UPI003075B153